MTSKKTRQQSRTEKRPTRKFRPPLIDPHAYARRVDYSQPPECVESQVAEIVAEAVLTAKGRVVQWRRCKNDNCGKLFPVGGWPLPGFRRSDAAYCTDECKRSDINRRHYEKIKEKNRKNRR